VVVWEKLGNYAMALDRHAVDKMKKYLYMVVDFF